MLIGGVAYAKIQALAATSTIVADKSNYLPDQTPPETFTAKATYASVYDDWRTELDRNAPNPFGNKPAVSPHGPISFDLTATGTLTEKTRTAYSTQVKYAPAPYAIGTANSGDFDNRLQLYKQQNNLTKTGTDLLAIYCEDILNQGQCIKNADQAEYLSASMDIQPTQSTGAVAAAQRAYSYQSFKSSTSILQGRKEDRLGSTYQEPITYTSSTGASVNKLSKDANGESILDYTENVSSGNSTKTSSDSTIVYTTNSNLNPAFIDYDKLNISSTGQYNKIAQTNLKPDSTQIQQSNTGNLYTTPLVFPNGNNISFNYYYSILSDPAINNNYDSATSILKTMHPEDQCNATTCYDLVKLNLNPAYLKNPQAALDECNSQKGTNCLGIYNNYVAQRSRMMGQCGGSEPEVFNLAPGNVCSMNSVSIQPQIYNSIAAPWGDAINTQKLVEKMVLTSDHVRLNRYAPALYTPVDINVKVTTSFKGVVVSPNDTKQAYLPGGRLETLAGQMLKLTAENSNPIAIRSNTNPKIFKDAYLTSDDRTYANGYIPTETSQMTPDYGVIYNVDPQRQAFGLLKSNSPDRKLYDFMTDLKTAYWNTGNYIDENQSFKNNTSVIFTEGQTNKTINGIARLSGLLPGFIYNVLPTFQNKNEIVFFSYDGSKLYVSGAGQVAEFSAYTNDDSGNVTGGGNVTKPGYLESRIPSVTTARVCATADSSSCYDDNFMIYTQAAPEGGTGGLRLARSVFRPSDLTRSTQKTDKVVFVGSSSSQKADDYYLRSEGNVNNKIFTYDDSKNLAVPNQNIIVVTDTSDVFMGTPEYSSITWMNQTVPIEKRIIGGVGAYVDPTAKFPYPIGDINQLSVYQDTKRSELHLVANTGKDDSGITDYSWPQGEAPTKDNVTVTKVPTFKKSQVIQARYDKKADTRYILVNIPSYDNAISNQTFIYESHGDNRNTFKVYFKDFDVDTTKVGGNPYTWDTTKYNDIEQFKAQDFLVNQNNQQFDGINGIDLAFGTSDRGSRVLTYMTMPYSRTSMYWGKDPDSVVAKTFAWTTDDNYGFKAVSLNKYYVGNFPVNNILNINQWKTQGALTVDPVNIKKGAAYLDNMFLMNPQKYDAQDEFYNRLQDAGDLTKYSGRTPDPTTGSNANSTYDKKYCEETWCVADTTPFVGDKFADDVNNSTMRSYFTKNARASTGSLENDWSLITSAAKNANIAGTGSKKTSVSMAIMLALYAQESSMNKAGGWFNCFSDSYTADLFGSAQCAADTMASRFSNLGADGKLENSPTCLAGSKFSGAMEQYTPLDRRREFVGSIGLASNVSNNLLNSCNQGLVKWDTTNALCTTGTNNSQNGRYPGCFTIGSGFGRVPVSCGITQTTDQMTDSRMNIRNALMMGQDNAVSTDFLNKLKQSDIASTLDPRLTLTTKCFGTSTAPASVGGNSSVDKKTSTAAINFDGQNIQYETLNVSYVNQALDATSDTQNDPNKNNAAVATDIAMLADYFGKLPITKSNLLTSNYVLSTKANSILEARYPALNKLTTQCSGLMRYTSEDCIGNSPDTMRKVMTDMGLKPQSYMFLNTTPSADLIQQIRDQLEKGNPVVAGIAMGDGQKYKNGSTSGHVFIIVGVSTDGKYIIANDPYNNRGEGGGASSAEGIGGKNAVYDFNEMKQFMKYTFAVSN